MKEVLLLSGGIDSIALAYWRRPICALTVDYGQRSAAKEIEVSSYIADKLCIAHKIVYLDLRNIGLGIMASGERSSLAPTPEWWPFRNQLLITVAAMTALKEKLSKVTIGTVSTDLAHADGTAAFVQYCQNLLGCQEGGVELEAPALALSSAQLLRKSGVPPSVLAAAHSCHRSNHACGQCRGCAKHEAVFREVGLL